MGSRRHAPEKLPYCPTLGPHHINWEARHFKTREQRMLRGFGGFILPLSVAPPAQHTMIHRSLRETPMPTRDDIYLMLEIARRGGLYDVISQVDNQTTEHYRRQLFIAAMNGAEVTERLRRKQYITKRELIGV